MEDKAPDYSVIITCYYEEQSIEEFHANLSETLENLGRSYEVIFVNDGSTDKTFENLKSIYDKDPNVSVIADLFRNVGQPGAITAGINLAKGTHFVLMDSDLQLDPKDLPSLINEFESGADVISGCRKWPRRQASRSFFQRCSSSSRGSSSSSWGRPPSSSTRISF